jgi:mono/diheme cytochrome c family protein
MRIVLLGLQGPIDVSGTAYNGIMPGLAAQMPDDEIAAVVSHVRGSFGNTASAVSAADVGQIRSEVQGRSQSWTAEELSGMAGAGAAPATAAPVPSPEPVIASAPAAAQVQPAASSGGSGGPSLFVGFACNTCHSVDDATPLVGPSLYDVGRRLSRGEIYESIIDPDARVAEGYSAGMMSAMLQSLDISGAELNRLVDYLASLRG